MFTLFSAGASVGVQKHLSRHASIELLTKITTNNINKLPATELRYYLFLLIAEIHNEKNPDKYILLLSDLNKLTLAIDAFYRNIKSVHCYEKLADITARLNTLSKNAPHTNFWQIKKILLDVCASIGAIIVGIIASGFGLTIGFFSQCNVFKGAYLGFMSGLGIGSIIGFRIPGKLVLTPWEAKLQFTLESIKKVINNLEIIREKVTTKQKPANNPYFSQSYNVYENTAKKYIIDTFFKDARYPTVQIKENAFRAFLKSEQFFEICSTQNGFLDRSLKGNLGNHTFIRYKINDIEAPAMEFGPRTKYPHWVDQKETARRVTGQKLFKMIAFDAQLQETHAMNLQFVFDSFRAGDNDCLTYVNKILLGTQQRPTVVKRFSEATDTWIGSKIVGSLFKFFSKTEEHEMDCIVPFLEDNQPLKVYTYKRPE